MTRKALALVTATWLVLPFPAGAAPPTGPLFSFEYAASFSCGTIVGPSITAAAPGSYFTLVNIHNPITPARYTYKVALADSNRPGEMTSFVLGLPMLRYDEVFYMDCREIRGLLNAERIMPGPFFTGFLVIEAGSALDVVVTYTTSGPSSASVTSIHTERVPLRRVH